MEPELGITAPCKLWCTLVALLISCEMQMELQLVPPGRTQSSVAHTRIISVMTSVQLTRHKSYFKFNEANSVPILSYYFHLLKTRSAAAVKSRMKCSIIDSCLAVNRECEVQNMRKKGKNIRGKKTPQLVFINMLSEIANKQSIAWGVIFGILQESNSLLEILILNQDNTTSKSNHTPTRSCGIGPTINQLHRTSAAYGPTHQYLI